MAAPERADRLVLAAFTYKGEGSPTLTKRAEQVDYYRTHNMRKRDREMIRSIATRDKPGTSEQAAVDVLADVEMQFGDQIPTGTYLDMVANLPVVDPHKVLSPVLLVRGEYDGIATVADLEEFFNLLPNGDRQFIILPGTAHSVDAGHQPAIVLARDPIVPHDADADRDVAVEGSLRRFHHGDAGGVGALWNLGFRIDRLGRHRHRYLAVHAGYGGEHAVRGHGECRR